MTTQMLHHDAKASSSSATPTAATEQLWVVPPHSTACTCSQLTARRDPTTLRTTVAFVPRLAPDPRLGFHILSILDPLPQESGRFALGVRAYSGRIRPAPPELRSAHLV